MAGAISPEIGIIIIVLIKIDMPKNRQRQMKKRFVFEKIYEVDWPWGLWYIKTIRISYEIDSKKVNPFLFVENEFYS